MASTSAAMLRRIARASSSSVILRGTMPTKGSVRSIAASDWAADDGASSAAKIRLSREVRELFLQVRHELIGDGAVDQPVVEREREVGHRADRDRIVDNDRP